MQISYLGAQRSEFSHDISDLFYNFIGNILFYYRQFHFLQFSKSWTEALLLVIPSQAGTQELLDMDLSLLLH